MNGRTPDPGLLLRCSRREVSHAKEPSINITRPGSRPSGKGPAEYFTGAVRIDPLFDASTAPASDSASANPTPSPSAAPPHVSPRTVGASVTFEPGARTAWHTHPLGQTLIVLAGCGWAQCAGKPREDLHPGDIVWIPPGEKHWHGATATTAMTHIAIQEKLDGKAVEWMEQVSEEQYLGNVRT